MKALFGVIIVCVYAVSFAGVDSNVVIRGRIGSSFDDQKVKVQDDKGQSYYLPRRLFPKDFEFKQGADFYLDIPAKEMEGIKIKKK